MSNARKMFADYAPNGLYALGYTLFSHLSNKREAVRVNREDDLWAVNPKNSTDSIIAPKPQFAVRFDCAGEFDFGQQKIRRYTLSGFVDVEPGDTVVDVGAFIGEFSHYAAKTAQEVVAIEPDPTSAACLRKNIRSQNVTVEESAVWKNDGILELEFGKDPTENSIFGVDRGEIRRTEEVPASRLDTLLSKHEIDSVDLLKMDAEGAEPEALEGLSNHNVRKFAIDCGAERDGKSTESDVVEGLTDRNYEIKSKDGIVYASA